MPTYYIDFFETGPFHKEEREPGAGTLDLLHVEQRQAGSQPCSRQDGAMHPKRGKLFDRFFPTDVESMESSKLAELGWADDERMASFQKNSADPLQTFS